jgi:hypothetical protein
MKPLIILISIYFTFAFVFTSCKDSGVNPPGTTISPTILNTDDQGRILGGDRNDWCGTTGMTHGPVYPNPVQGRFNIKFSIVQNQFVDIYFKDSTNFETVFIRDSLAAGLYVIQPSVTQYMRDYKILKLYMRLGTESDCTGDVQFY